MAVYIRELLEKFPDLLTLHRGDLTQSVQSLKDPGQATSEDLIFIFNAKSLKENGSTKARAWLVQKDLADQVPPTASVVIKSANPQLAMARIAKQFFPVVSQRVPVDGLRIHPSAQISKSAQIGQNCIIGPGAVIGDHCVLGDQCVVGANAVLEPHVKLGARTHIHPLVFIGHSCELGMDCEVQPHTTIGSEGFGYAYDAAYNAERLTHYGRVILEDRVQVGAGVQIDRGTFTDSRIGHDTKIDNHSHFGHNIEIGHNTIIPGGMIAAGSATIGSYCVFGGRTTIAGHLTIADKTKVSGLSGVSKSITKAGEYGGYPLQELSESMRTKVAIRQLPDLVRQVRQIVKHLGLSLESDKGSSKE